MYGVFNVDDMVDVGWYVWLVDDVIVDVVVCGLVFVVVGGIGLYLCFFFYGLVVVLVVELGTCERFFVELVQFGKKVMFE